MEENTKYIYNHFPFSIDGYYRLNIARSSSQHDEEMAQPATSKNGAHLHHIRLTLIYAIAIPLQHIDRPVTMNRPKNSMQLLHQQHNQSQQKEGTIRPRPAIVAKGATSASAFLKAGQYNAHPWPGYILEYSACLCVHILAKHQSSKRRHH